jgi:predicted ester cyclase
MSCRIERVANGAHVVLRVSGRVRASDLATLTESIGPDVESFDLREVTIVDREVVSFLVRRERQGIPCQTCPSFLREWMDAERRHVEGDEGVFVNGRLGESERQMAQGPPTPVTVVSEFIERVVNGGDFSLIDQFWAEDLAWHGGSLGDIRGLAALESFMRHSGAGAFSGMHLKVEEILSVGSKVVVRFTNSGTQTGTFMGAPPSGKRAEWLGIGIYTVNNGRIVEGWFGEDVLGMLMQLGIVNLSA